VVLVTVRRELAACCPLYPQILLSPPIPIPPLPESLAREILPGDGITPECADPHLEVLRPPYPVIEDLGEVAGVPSAPNDAPGIPEGLEFLGLVRAAVGMQEPGGALGATNVGLPA
jgi:hypothetical protein